MFKYSEELKKTLYLYIQNLMILLSHWTINIFFILMRFYLTNITLLAKENKIRMDLNIENKN